MNQSIRVYKLFRIWILFLFVYSMYPWFAWNIPQYAIVAVTVIAFAYISTQINVFGKFSISSPLSVFILLTCLWIHNYSIFSLLSGVLTWVCIYYMLKLKEEYKCDLIRFITKWFAILSLVSLIAFLLYRFGLSLPSKTIYLGDDVLSGYGEYENYYLFVTMWRSGGFRFQSIFAEPGHYTMGLAPLIFINKYNWKNPYVAILIIAQLFTFSLAGYIVFIVGYLYTIVSEKRVSSIMTRILSFALIVFAFTTLSSYFYEDDMVESHIFDRIEEGNFSRSDQQFERAYASLLNSPEVLFGKSVLDIDVVAAGYKRYVYVHGILGLTCILLMYLLIWNRCKWNKRRTFGLIVVFFLLLYQNAYPFWWCMLISLILGSSYMANENQLIENK